jgi:transcriptional regulator with XRE-family HTH domain
MHHETLIDKRKERSWTQAEMAEYLGCSRQAVINWEKGRYKIPKEVEDKLGSAAPKRVKLLEGHPFYKWDNKHKGTQIRQLAHPFWFLDVCSPYRKLVEASDLKWNERAATTADLEGYAAPTPEQAMAQLVANKVSESDAHHFITKRMGYRLPDLPVVETPFTQYQRDWAEFQRNNPEAGWRLFEELYPQHCETHNAKPVDPAEVAAIGAELERLLKE